MSLFVLHPLATASSERGLSRSARCGFLVVGVGGRIVKLADFFAHEYLIETLRKDRAIGQLERHITH
jgi:hypothetical protein